MFEKKKNRELDMILSKVYSNMANNYKDAAQEAFKEFEMKAAELEALGNLNSKQKAYYRESADKLRGDLKNFTHKDQKPYWT